jgi:hypothetical protein
MNTFQLDNPCNISAITTSKTVIYDFGANNGDDIPYYLKKAELVVAVEANPSLCQKIEERAGLANSDRVLSGGSVLPQPKMAEMRRADEQTSASEPHSVV